MGTTEQTPEQVLGNFVAALRRAELEVSPAETLDAMAALDIVGYEDRRLFRDTLALVLAKTPREKAAFNVCFDRFFSARQFRTGGGAAFRERARELAGQTGAAGGHAEDDGDSEGEGKNEGNNDGEGEGRNRRRRGRGARGGLALHESALGHLLLQGTDDELRLAMQRAATEVHLERIRTLRERSLYARRIEQHMGAADLDQTIASLRESSDERASRTAALLSEARVWLAEQVKDYVEEQYLLIVDGTGDRFLRDAVTGTQLTNMQPYYFEHIREAVRKLAHQLAKRHARKRRLYNKGHLDVRRTLRRNLQYDGALFDLRWKQIKVEPPKVFVLCDVSGSVRTVSRFLLTFLYSLGEVLPLVRAFAFSNELGEVTPFFADYTLEEAIEMSLDDYGKGSTDYGTALRTFRELAWRDLDSSSTIIILGDGRNNYFASGADTLKALSRRSRQVIWLNPESRDRWKEGDAEMAAYLPSCHVAEVCNSLPDLERMVGRVLRSAN